VVGVADELTPGTSQDEIADVEGRVDQRRVRYSSWSW